MYYTQKDILIITKQVFVLNAVFDLVLTLRIFYIHKYLGEKKATSLLSKKKIYKFFDKHATVTWITFKIIVSQVVCKFSIADFLVFTCRLECCAI